MRLLVGAASGDAKLQQRAARLVLKLADITVKGARGGKVKLELKTFLWMDLHLHLVTAAHVGHLQRIRRREELRGAACSFSFSLWYRDRVLITDDQQKDSEGGDGNNGPEPTEPAAAGWHGVPFYGVLPLGTHHLACGVHKNRSSLEIERAFGAVEAMLFIFVALGLGEFAEHILYSGLQSYRFAMVHLCHPTGSAGGCNIVSLVPQWAARCATPSWPFSYKTLFLSLARCRSTLK